MRRRPFDTVCTCPYSEPGLECICTKPKSEAKEACADCMNGNHYMRSTRPVRQMSERFMSTPLWVLSARLSKQEPGLQITSGMCGWRICEFEATAKGLFMEAIAENKPGFSIDEISCLQVPDSALRQALGLPERESKI